MGRSKAIVLHPQHQSKKSLDAVYRPSNIRIRRAILAGKRGPTTPVPSWKLYENPSYDGIIAGTEVAGRQITISARKLAATLWELQELPLLCRGPPSSGKSPGSGTAGSHSRVSGNSHRLHRRKESVDSPKPLMLPPPSPATPVPQNYIKPTSTKSSDSQRRSPFSDSVTCHSRRASEEMYTETPRRSFEKHQQEDVLGEERIKSDGFSSSTEFLKVLNHMRGVDGNQGGGPMSLAAVLRVELEHTRQRVKDLEHANKLARRDIETLVERAEAERVQWRAKEQERFRAAILAAKHEADEMRKLKRKAELANRKLGQQFDEVNLALSRAVKDLEKERKARQLMEDVCDELAREIGHDKAEVEQLKRDAEKVREEVEEERRMLQMAEVWREERVQMKLAEARHELEEKSVTLDKLKAELEEFLQSKTTAAGNGQTQELEKAKMLRAAVDTLRKPHTRGVNEDGGGGSSAEEDLHSIDLNKESLYDRTQGNRWTYNRSQNQPSEKVAWNEKKPKKGVRGRRRMRKQRTYDENIEHEQGCGAGKYESSELVRNGNEQENGPNESGSDGKEDYHRASPTLRGGRIETIPEQHELYMRPSRHKRDATRHGSVSPEDDDFAIGYAQREAGGSRTPTLSPLLHSASFPVSTVVTPQRNSWSSGDLNPQLAKALRGSVEWPRLGGAAAAAAAAAARDNSLRAKLLEAKMEEPYHPQQHHYHHHHRSKRDN